MEISAAAYLQGDVTVSVSTPASSAVWTIPSWQWPLGPWPAVALIGSLASLVLLSRRRKISWIGAALMTVTLSSACGGSNGGGGGTNSPPPITPQSHTITVTATSQAGAVKLTTLNLTVN